jgi:tetratricopeptide (TPR) repeat protein
MPFELRAVLHQRVGEDIERTEADRLDRHLDLLAHHFWNSHDEAKKREYLLRAGTAAQAAYSNAAAIDYFERLVPLLGGSERARTMLRLGKVLELVGLWGRAEDVEQEALALATELGDASTQGWSEAALAEVARKQGRYDEATRHLDAATILFRALGEESGVGQVLHLAGTVAAQRGEYDVARARYEESLAIRERLGDMPSLGALYSNLGIVAEYGGDYNEARRLNERALEIRLETGDRWAIGVSENNLGMIALQQRQFEEARARFEESMRLHREVGDAWSVALHHNNLGNAHRELGEFEAARADYAWSLRAYRDYEDRWGLAYLLEDIGLLGVRVGDHERALELVESAATLRAEIGAPRAPSLDESLRNELAGSLAALDPDRVEAARLRGRLNGLDDAIESAMVLCGTT